MILRFKPYVASRFASWTHVWEAAVVDGAGFQQSRTMSAAASGGLIGVGPGEGWLESVPAADTDMVFGMLIEEWGFIIAVLAVLSIVTLSIFAYRSIFAGRSTYYTIAACGACPCSYSRLCSTYSAAWIFCRLQELLFRLYLTEVPV